MIDDEPELDEYGNDVNGNELTYCCFPDCGCDGARLCNAKNGPSRSACALNYEHGYSFLDAAQSTTKD